MMFSTRNDKKRTQERELLLLNDLNPTTTNDGYQPIIGTNEKILSSFVGKSFDGITKPGTSKWNQKLANAGRICIALAIIIVTSIIINKVWYVNRQPVVPTNPFQRLSLTPQLDDSSSELLMVNVIFRHGDRSPIKINHLGMQPLLQQSAHIWPDGLGNITDVGQLRMFKLGMALQKLYRTKLRAHNSNSMMAFSSDTERCINSLKLLLRAFYNFEVTIERGLRIVRDSPHCAKTPDKDVCKVLSDSGWPDEWKRVKIDHDTMTGLRSKYIAHHCTNFNATKCHLYSSLDSDIRTVTVPGFEELRQEIAASSGDKYDFDLVGFFPDLVAILKVATVPEVHKLLLPHASWLTKPVAELGNRKLTLFDTLEGLNLIGDYICFADGEMGRLQTSQIITSLIESQATALGEKIESEMPLSSYDYTDKRIIMYATHDTLIEMLLDHLGISKLSKNGTMFGENFMNFKSETGNEVEELLGGFKRATFGASIIFELRRISPPSNNLNQKPFAFVRSSIYQRDDAIYDDVEFQAIKMGLFCQASFRMQYGHDAYMDLFYSGVSSASINKDFDCPFELWKNVTGNRVIPSSELDVLCNG